MKLVCIKEEDWFLMITGERKEIDKETKEKLARDGRLIVTLMGSGVEVSSWKGILAIESIIRAQKLVGNCLVGSWQRCPFIRENGKIRLPDYHVEMI